MAGTATVGALKVVLGLDSAAFTDGLNAAQKHLKGVGSTMQRVGTQLATVGAGLTASLTVPIAALGVSFTKAAIDAEEMQSAFNVSFGAMAKDARRWAETTGDAMGRSTFELQQMALGFNGLFKAGGPITAQAAEMSRQFTTLAQDLSSFHNVSEQDAFQALRSGLSGESEPLRRFNVYLTEGSVKAEAYALGIAKAGAELTEQQKIQARASLIMKATAEAQGDVIRTSAGTQNQLRALKSQWAELSVTLGSAILPVLTPIVTALGNMARSFSGLSPAMQQAVLIGSALAAALGPVLIVVGAVVSAVGTLTAALAGAGLAAAFAAALPVIAGVAAVVAVAVGAFLLFKDDVQPVLASFWDTIQKTLGPALGDLFAAIGETVGQMAALFKQFFASEAGRALVQFGAVVSTILGTTVIQVLTALVKIVTTVVRAIGDGFKILGLLLKGDFVGAWNAYREGTMRAVDGIKGALGGLASYAIEAIRKMVNGVATWLTGKLFDVLKGVVSKVKTVSDAFFKLYDAVVGHSYIPDMVEGVAAWMAKLDAGMVAPAKSATDATKATFESLRDDVAAIMESLLTDTERAARDLAAKTKTIQDAVKAGQLTAGQGARAEAGVAGLGLSMPTFDPVAPFDVELPKVIAGPKVNAAFEDAAARFGDEFSYNMERVLRGDIKGVFNDMLSSVLSGAMSSFGASLFNGGSGSGAGGLLSSIGSMFAGFKLPGFKTGGSFTVGGSGGLDSQTVAFRASPGEMVDIRKAGQDMNGGGLIRVVVDKSKYFDTHVERIASGPAAAYSGAAYSAARGSIPAEQARRNRYRLA